MQPSLRKQVWVLQTFRGILQQLLIYTKCKFTLDLLFATSSEIISLPALYLMFNVSFFLLDFMLNFLFVRVRQRFLNH